MAHSRIDAHAARVVPSEDENAPAGIVGIGHPRVEEVAPGSPAEEAGITPGEFLLSINGKPVRDEIDYRFLSADEEVTIEVSRGRGVSTCGYGARELVRTVHVRKEYGEPLGLRFSDAIFDGIIPCRNRCLFCFVDQLPRGMRGSLYVKDDDYRLSFLHGNFVTLTNLSDEDMDRIISMRIMPLYISVHATDPDLRRVLLCNRNAGRIMEQIGNLASAGITMHAQVVLCPDINDGSALDKTIADLASFWPSMRSIAVVPVGLTRHREGLARLRPLSYEDAKTIVAQVEGWQGRFARKFGYRLVFLADEFYLKLSRPVPSRRSYEDFPQIENGVGLVRLFLDDFRRISRRLPEALSRRRRVSIVTGELAFPVLERIAKRLNRVAGLEVRVFAVENRFFGNNVTVAGLLTGHDIIQALKGKDLGEVVLIPSVVLRGGEEAFLDDMRVSDVEQELGTTVTVVDVDARSLVKGLINLEWS